MTWAPPPHTPTPVTFHDGHWVFYLWPKYIRSKNGCQVLDAHLVDIGVGLYFIQKPAGEEKAVGGEANPVPAVLGAAWRPHPATPTFPGPRAQPAAPARSERAELPLGPGVGGSRSKSQWLSAWKGDTRLSRLQWGQRSGRAQAPTLHTRSQHLSWGHGQEAASWGRDCERH